MIEKDFTLVRIWLYCHYQQVIVLFINHHQTFFQWHNATKVPQPWPKLFLLIAG